MHHGVFFLATELLVSIPGVGRWEMPILNQNGVGDDSWTNMQRVACPTRIEEEDQPGLRTFMLHSGLWRRQEHWKSKVPSRHDAG